MDKKEIYEHLARIYLDASSKKKKKTKEKQGVKNFFLVNLIIISGVGLFLFISHKNKLITSKPNITSELALVLHSDIVKLNFNFDPAEKEIYSMNLDGLDLRRFKVLGFSVRKANFDDKITLRIEFTNTLKESSEVYIRDIKSYKWHECHIALSDFKNISSWSEMANLSFIIEERNVKEKKSIVYIDNVRLLH